MHRTLRRPALWLCALAFLPLGPTRVAAAADAPLAAIVHPLPPVGVAPGQAIQVNAANVSTGVEPEGGRLVVPRGSRWGQELVQVVKTDGGAVERASVPCRFVPLLGAGGFHRA